MIRIAHAVHFEGLHHFHHGRRHRQGNTHAMRRIQHIVQIFDMQVNPETGVEFTVHYQRRFGIKHSAAGQTAADCLINQFRLNAGLSCQYQRFRHGGNINGHNNLVGQLGNIPGANTACYNNRPGHGFHDIVAFVKYMFFSANHNG